MRLQKQDAGFDTYFEIVKKIHFPVPDLLLGISTFS